MVYFYLTFRVVKDIFLAFQNQIQATKIYGKMKEKKGGRFMGGKITKREITPLYDMAKRVYHKKIQIEPAISSLVISYGINKNSMKDYINCFKAMMEGKVYKRTINNEATSYYLQEILKDYGTEQLKKAINSVQAHVEYYSLQGKGNLASTRRIISQFNTLVKSSE